MYRIKLQSGEESEFGSFEELCFGIVSGIIGPDDEIYHARASKWLPIQTHPDYKRAVAQAPPPSPAMVSQSSSSPAGVLGGHDDAPDEEGGQDLMTLLDLEELTAFNPGKVQESAPLQEEAETAELEPIEANESAGLETNGHAAPGLPEADQPDEPAADTEDATALEAEEPAVEMEAEDEADETQVVELLRDDEELAEEPARAELDIDKETELDDRDEATMAELALGDDEAVTGLEDDESATDDAEPEETEPGFDEVDGFVADAADGSRDIDYVAAEDVDDLPMMESVVAEAEADVTEDGDIEQVDDNEDEEEATAQSSMDQAADVEDDAAEEAEVVEDDEPMDEPVDPATLEVEEEFVEDAADLEDGDTDEDIALEVEPVAQADDDEADEDEDEATDESAMDQAAYVEDDVAEEAEVVEDDEATDEAVEPAMLEAEDEVVEEAADLEDDLSDEDAELEVEPAGQADDDEADDDALLGGPVIELDHLMDVEPSDADAGDELEPAAELIATAEAADPIDAFQPAMDDDLFQDTFSPVPELDSRRRFPVLPVAIAAGVVAMAALGWILMGSSGSEEPAAVVDPATPAPAAVPAASANLNQQSLAAEDPSEEMQRRYDEAYDRARSRLDADLRRAGFAAVFAPGNFAGEDSMVTARAAIAAASLAVSAYAGREQSIREDFPDADPTGRESRAHRELSEDLLAVSQQIYGLLLAKREAFALRNGAMTITDPAVESEYTRLVDEVNRLMRLAATADEARAATIRRIAAAIGNTRPPPVAQLAPPPALPTDL